MQCTYQLFDKIFSTSELKVKKKNKKKTYHAFKEVTNNKKPQFWLSFMYFQMQENERRNENKLLNFNL